MHPPVDRCPSWPHGGHASKTPPRSRGLIPRSHGRSPGGRRANHRCRCPAPSRPRPIRRAPWFPLPSWVQTGLRSTGAIGSRRSCRAVGSRPPANRGVAGPSRTGDPRRASPSPPATRPWRRRHRYPPSNDPCRNPAGSSRALPSGPRTGHPPRSGKGRARQNRWRRPSQAGRRGSSPRTTRCRCALLPWLPGPTRG